MTATKTQVQIGHRLIEGYLTDDGELGMSLSQLAELVGWDVKRGSHFSKLKGVKALTAQGFPGSYKVKTNLNGKVSHANIIHLDWVVPVLQVVAFGGNLEAQQFLGELAGLSLQKLFCTAFGIKFTNEESQAWLKARQESKFYRRTFTDAVKALKDKGVEIDYAFVTMLIYGKCDLTTAYLAYKQEFKDNKFRETLTERQLKNVMKLEELSADFVCVDNMPLEAAIQQAGRYIR